MDDTLESDVTVSPSRDLTEVMKRGGFHLTKWASKSSEFLREIAEIKEIEPQRSPAVQTLGVVYNPSVSCHRFGIHFVVCGKVFLQELWPLKLEWDDVVDEVRLEVWAKFEQEARSLD